MVESTRRSADAEAKRAADELRDGAKEVGRSVGEAVKARSEGLFDEQKTAAASRVSGVASAMRSTASQLEDSDARIFAPYIERAAGRLERIAEGLRAQEPAALLDTAENFAREQPAAFFSASVGLGVAAGRFLKSSAARRRPSRVRDDEFEAGPQAFARRSPRAPTGPSTTGATSSLPNPHEITVEPGVGPRSDSEPQNRHVSRELNSDPGRRS
jgi:hypothetical protein